MINVNSYDYGYAIGETYHLPDYKPFDETNIPLYQQIGGANHMKGGSFIAGVMSGLLPYAVPYAVDAGIKLYKTMYPEKKTEGTVIPSTSDKTQVYTNQQRSEGEPYPVDGLLKKLQKKYGNLDTMDNRKLAYSIRKANRNNPEYLMWIKMKNNMKTPGELKEFKIETKQELNKVKSTRKWSMKTILKGLAVLGATYMASHYKQGLDWIKKSPNIVRAYNQKVPKYIRQYGPQVLKYGEKNILPKIKDYAFKGKHLGSDTWKKYGPVLKKMKVLAQPYIKKYSEALQKRWAPKFNPGLNEGVNTFLNSGVLNEFLNSTGKKKFYRGRIRRRRKTWKGRGKKRKMKRNQKKYLKQKQLKNIIDKLI